MVTWHTKNVRLDGQLIRVAVLLAESGQNAYECLILADGRTELQVNCRAVAKFPNSPIARNVMGAAAVFKDRIVAYLGMDPASTEGKAAWWAITDALKVAYDPEDAKVRIS